MTPFKVTLNLGKDQAELSPQEILNFYTEKFRKEFSDPELKFYGLIYHCDLCKKPRKTYEHCEKVYDYCETCADKNKCPTCNGDLVDKKFSVTEP